MSLGALLRQIRDRRLWNPLGFADFEGYVRERLGMSARTARRLIRAEAAGWRHPSLKTACLEGRLTTLKASVLVRVLDLGLKPPMTRRWVEYARRMTLARLTDAVDGACAHAAADPLWVRRDGAPPHPSFRFDGGTSAGAATGGEGSTEQRPMLATSPASIAQEPSQLADPSGGTRKTRPMLATSPTIAMRIWLTEGERHVLELAIKGVRAARGPDWPLWACLNDLLDHFAAAYEDPAYRALSRCTPVLIRDDWHCQAPGCRARSGLHVHHIRPRGVGGPNTFDNLIVVCDFHHMVIHRGWVRCWGKAPDRLRWSFAERGYDVYIHRFRFHEVNEPEPLRTPVARFVGHYRLDGNERFPQAEVALFGSMTRIVRKAPAA